MRLMPLPNPDLDQAFDAYNKSYFEGQLPEVSCRYADVLRDQFGNLMVGYLYWTGSPAETMIEISTLLSGAANLIRLTLLHEMVHLKFNDLDYEREQKRDSHGPHFEKEMQRLAAAGAFKGLW